MDKSSELSIEFITNLALFLSEFFKSHARLLEDNGSNGVSHIFGLCFSMDGLIGYIASSSTWYGILDKDKYGRRYRSFQDLFGMVEEIGIGALSRFSSKQYLFYFSLLKLPSIILWILLLLAMNVYNSMVPYYLPFEEYVVFSFVLLLSCPHLVILSDNDK